MYGLESINLSKCDIQKLELYQRTIIRQILHLPERVTSSAVYISSGSGNSQKETNIVREHCEEGMR